MDIHIVARHPNSPIINIWDISIVGMDEKIGIIRLTDDGVYILSGISAVTTHNSLLEARNHAQCILNRMSVLIN